MDREKFIDGLRKYEIYNDDLERIREAYDIGEKAHEGQKRKSGEPYFTHPIAVSEIIASWRLDADTVIAGLLHDVIEDTPYTYEDIKEKFGKEIADLVEGVTKLEKVKYEDKEQFQADNLRKMILSMAKDVRVVLIKLADRLHNMKTLKFQSDDRKKPIAQETLEIYAPFAHRLGMSMVKWELEDLSFLYMDPEKYYDIVAKVNKKQSEREENINKIIDTIKLGLEDFGIEYVEVYGRPKNYYSIFKKMFQQHKLFSELYDITAVRIIVKDVKDCYGALGVVHSLWNPIPNRFKDYIATPKPNMYQSIHTTVVSKMSEPFEIQIRTEEMHQIAENGIAAHFKYKHGDSNDSSIDKRLTWIRQMFEAEQEGNTSAEYLDTIKFELNSEEVYVFTPQGKVIELPVGSTPVDFAYKIHSDVGNRCIGAKVDGRIVPLSMQLENGKIVEIITSKIAGGPSRDWLKFVKTTQAKNKIKHWFKKERREENIEKGKEMLEREIVRSGFRLKDFHRNDWNDAILSKLTVGTLDDLYAAIGYGGIATNQVIPKLRDLVREEQKKQVKEKMIEEALDPNKAKPKRDNHKSKSGIIVEGLDDTEIRLAKCCSPVPGDKIIGFITRGRGITVHQVDCSNLETSEEARSRYIEVKWAENKEASYGAEIQITAPDRHSLLSDVTKVPADLNVVVNGLNSRRGNDGVTIININVEVNSQDELNKIIMKFKSFRDVISVRRVKN